MPVTRFASAPALPMIAFTDSESTHVVQAAFGHTPVLRQQVAPHHGVDALVTVEVKGHTLPVFMMR